MIQLSKLPVADIPFDGFVMLNGQLVLDKQQNMLFGTPHTGGIPRGGDHHYGVGHRISPLIVCICLYYSEKLRNRQFQTCIFFVTLV